MPHFFIQSNDINGNSIIISDNENYRHIAKSLRAKIGEKLLLIDENKFQYETEITAIDSQTIETKIYKKYPSKKILDFDLYLAQSPLRSDAQSFIIEKATELGIKGIYPVLTDNCALSKTVIAKKNSKWQKIMYEAAKQCERCTIPECFELTTLEKLLSIPEKFDKIIAFTERDNDMTLHEFFEKSHVKQGESLLVIIGPEGGFSAREFDFFKKENIPRLTLGNLILKAETAVTVALGNIIYEFENYRKN